MEQVETSGRNDTVLDQKDDGEGKIEWTESKLHMGKGGGKNGIVL